MMNGQEKSDFGVVAEKPANNGGEPSAERAEPRPETKGNAGQQSTHRAQDRARVTQALDRVRQASPSTTRGRSHMRESRPCGSERGAPSNGRPYRNRCPADSAGAFIRRRVGSSIRRNRSIGFAEADDCPDGYRRADSRSALNSDEAPKPLPVS